MNNKEFESVHLMTKTKVFDTYHLYYIDEINGFRYIADRTIKLRKFRKIIEENDVSIIIEENLDNYPSRKKYYKTKEFAQKEMEIL